ncbi:diguanylate cyclase [Paraburkholderia phymatum]|uniref:Diguanylate cyclase n=1 Tax=Paraburkholderia phymatum (strain DSM 17167 / CIP 108236 / LMG 21445 / STM815) TaxID=391038 RepID=B2JLE9_PARP8|nr:sensor domain-containing diguanylate cyclase [Paraburkholderia phymatum]ACC74117.1 diguanylate cyclase [Paraburkholderia phymatum STM815]
MRTRFPAIGFVLGTPARRQNTVSDTVRASLLSTAFDNAHPLFMAGLASAFVALVAYCRLHAAWAAIWLGVDVSILAARLLCIGAYERRNRASARHPDACAARYAPLCLLATLVLGLGTMSCVISPDRQLAALAIMVTAGILGGIGSRNAALPRLAIAQIVLGAVPIGIGAIAAPSRGSWILVPPLAAYLVAMVSIVWRHYDGLLALMSAEQRHAELAARFDAALAHMPHGLCTIDTAGKVVIANRRTAELFGARVERLKLDVPLPEFIGHVGLAHFDGPAFRAQIEERCAAWLHGERRAFDLELRDGRHLEITRNPVPDGSAVIIIEDVTQRRESEARILHLARHDPLTGLANRREFHDRLKLMLSAAPASAASRAAVFYLDLDGFKNVNDNLGHGAGDEVLTMVAARLEQTLRDGELAARLGGDEFAVIVRDSTPLVVATIARRIIRVVSRPYRLAAGRTVSIGTSIGIALSAPDDAVDALISRADEALYAAKQAGKGTFRVSQRDGVLL